MDVKVLASSSEGNAYLINDGETNLLLECGIPFRELQIKTNFFQPKVDGCLISHIHGDHLQDPLRLMGVGITCYMNEATLIGCKDYEQFYRAEVVKHGERFSIGTFDILPLEMKHDVDCTGYYLYSRKSKKSLIFATDTYYIPYILPSMDYIMVEANYDIDILNQRILDGHIEPAMKNRLAKSHMEVGNTIKWLEQQDLSKTRRIYLLHLSYGSSNSEDFKRRVIEATGVPVTIAGD